VCESVLFVCLCAVVLRCCGPTVLLCSVLWL